MQSLRARLIAGLLVLTAIGLLIAGTVTYVEQRSFLLDRVDQQALAAAPAMAQQLDEHGYRPPDGDGQGGGHFPGGRDGGPRPENVNLPSGTYGQRRTADGKVIGSTAISYGDALPSAPKIPADLKVGRHITVSAKSGGLRYRVVASRDPNDSGITVVAIPLRDVNQTLDRLLGVEALVVAGVLLALGLTRSRSFDSDCGRSIAWRPWPARSPRAECTSAWTRPRTRRRSGGWDFH
jgi:two-component system, OmpR family, sensor kinase